MASTVLCLGAPAILCGVHPPLCWQVNRKNTAQHAAEREELAARHKQRAAGPRSFSSQAELHALQQQQQQQQQAHQASLAAASLGQQQAMAGHALRLQPAHQQAAFQHAPRSVGLADGGSVSHVAHVQHQQTPPLQLGRGPGYRQFGASGAQGLQPGPTHMQMPGMGGRLNIVPLCCVDANFRPKAATAAAASRVHRMCDRDLDDVLQDWREALGAFIKRSRGVHGLVPHGNRLTPFH